MKKTVKKEKDNTIMRLEAEAKPIALWLALGAVLDILAVLCAVAAPEILGGLVQILYDYWDGGRVGTVADALLEGIWVLVVVYGAHGLLSWLNMLLMNKVVSRHFTCNIRIKISEKIKRLPVKYVDQTPVGDILSRMTGDVSEIGGYVHQIFDIMVKGIFQIVMIAVAMFLENWILACFVVLLTPLSMLLSSKIAGISEKHYDDMFAASGKLTELVEESFSNYPTTKAYNLEEYTQEKHTKVNQKLYDSTAKANFTGSVVQPLIKFSNALAYILINLIGGLLMLKSGVSVGVVVTIVLYARQFASPLEQIAMGFANLNHVKASARRVFAIFDAEEEETSGDSPEEEVKGRIEFRNVGFSYTKEEPLIEDLNLQVQPGQNVAVVGPTGAGKTTIVNLLMRFYDIDSGTILLDGRNTAELSRDALRERFGMVLQDTWLFRGTILENVAYGKPGASREEVEDACRRAYCDHFIRTMPDGYDTVIGEDTTNLSGGQKQLLTIARAFLADKPLLILDEATSNVDTRTEVLIQKAMDELMKGKTCFVIAHRLSTIVDSDVILVLDHGHIVEQGTHKELLNKQGFYHRLYQSQYAI
ncbi:MAG: ABC transporter ATP-binding protein [Oscillospiraceae bacterium]|nr:ABC transporter ATP-binding protein [Oscillospiraceae bacterium]